MACDRTFTNAPPSPTPAADDADDRTTPVDASSAGTGGGGGLSANITAVIVAGVIFAVALAALAVWATRRPHSMPVSTQLRTAYADPAAFDDTEI